jgi:hypothetical protein
MKRIRLPLLTVLATSFLAACAPVDSSAPDDAVAMDSSALANGITWRGSSVSALDQATGPATSITIARPSGTIAGDVEVAVVASYAWVAVTPPSGFTLVKTQTDTGSTVSGGGVATSVFVRVAGAAEPGTYAFGFSGKARGIATIQAYSNVDPSNPIDAVASAAETTSKTSHATPSLATTKSGAVLLGVYGIVNPLEPASATSTMPHERVDRSCGNAGSWGINLAVYDTDPRGGPATEAARSAVSSSATDTAAMTLVALRPKASTLFGASFTDRSTAGYDQIVGQFGGLQVDRSFGGTTGVSPFLTKYQPVDVARGAASAYSFKYLPTEVLAGQHDAAFHSFFQGIQDNQPVFWTYWHEPDAELYVDHIFTPTDYRAAWKHIKQIGDAEKASRPNLKIYATLIIEEWSMTPAIAPGRPLLGANGMYPGDDVIDVFGPDVYNSAASKGVIADPATQFGKIIDFAQAHGKPWAVPELGSCPVAGNAQGRATYLKQAIQYWVDRAYPPVYAAYFNLDWSTCDYRLDNDAPALKVWHDATVTGLSAFN